MPRGRGGMAPAGAAGATTTHLDASKDREFVPKPQRRGSAKALTTAEHSECGKVLHGDCSHWGSAPSPSGGSTAGLAGMGTHTCSEFAAKHMGITPSRRPVRDVNNSTVEDLLFGGAKQSAASDNDLVPLYAGGAGIHSLKIGDRSHGPYIGKEQPQRRLKEAIDGASGAGRPAEEVGQDDSLYGGIYGVKRLQRRSSASNADTLLGRTAAGGANQLAPADLTGAAGVEKEKLSTLAPEGRRAHRVAVNTMQSSAFVGENESHVKHVPHIGSTAAELMYGKLADNIDGYLHASAYEGRLGDHIGRLDTRGGSSQKKRPEPPAEKPNLRHLIGGRGEADVSTAAHEGFGVRSHAPKGRKDDDASVRTTAKLTDAQLYGNHSLFRSSHEHLPPEEGAVPVSGADGQKVGNLVNVKEGIYARPCDPRDFSAAAGISTASQSKPMSQAYIDEYKTGKYKMVDSEAELAGAAGLHSSTGAAGTYHIAFSKERQRAHVTPLVGNGTEAAEAIFGRTHAAAASDPQAGWGGAIGVDSSALSASPCERHGCFSGIQRKSVEPRDSLQANLDGQAFLRSVEVDPHYASAAGVSTLRTVAKQTRETEVGAERRRLRPQEMLPTTPPPHPGDLHTPYAARQSTAELSELYGSALGGVLYGREGGRESFRCEHPSDFVGGGASAELDARAGLRTGKLAQLRSPPLKAEATPAEAARAAREQRYSYAHPPTLSGGGVDVAR